MGGSVDGDGIRGLGGGEVPGQLLDYLEPCSPEQRWHKPDKWAVKKKGRKTAVRVYESEKDARVRAMEENKKADSNDLYYVEFREGEDTRCQSYCSVAQFCPYGRKFFQES